MWYKNVGTTFVNSFCHKSRVWQTDIQLSHRYIIQRGKNHFCTVSRSHFTSSPLWSVGYKRIVWAIPLSEWVGGFSPTDANLCLHKYNSVSCTSALNGIIMYHAEGSATVTWLRDCIATLLMAMNDNRVTNFPALTPRFLLWFTARVSDSKVIGLRRENRFRNFNNVSTNEYPCGRTRFTSIYCWFVI